MPFDDPDILRRFVRSADEDDSLRRLILGAMLRMKRRRIHSAASLPADASVAEKLNRKRFASNQSQKLRRRILGASRPPIAKDILAFKLREHPVLSAVLPERVSMWKSVLKRDRFSEPAVIKVTQLSFIHDPVAALEFFRDIARVEATALCVRIDFDFEYVDDIGPFLLMAEVWPSLAPVFSGGGTMYPAVQKVLEAVGLRGSLGMAFPGLKDLRDVWAMPVQKRRQSGTSTSASRYLEPQTNEMAAGRFCDEVNRWLGAAKTQAELTATGRRELSQIVNELLDNAERHSSYRDKDGSWTVAAFMARRVVDGEIRHVCHLAILSLGDTVCESLDATAAEDLRYKLDGFLSDMRTANAEQSRETLITLAAIQDGVTRDPEAWERKSGGYGFMEFVDSVNLLGLSKRPELKPQITIMSGSSCITLRDDYIRGLRTDDKGPRKQYFNSCNSVDEAPDVTFVRDLPLRLPGTVISVVFTLDPEFYRTTLNASD